MAKPTKEQVKEFWEGYGIEPEKNYGEPPGYILRYPPIDLSSLFQYAVPKVKTEYRNWKSVLHDWVDELTGDYEKDALALFWALWKVKEGG